MNRPELPRHPDAKRAESNAELRARYEHLRGVSKKLGNKHMEQISKETLYEGARRLGMLEGKTIVFDSEDEMALLMDYCLYNVRQKGKTVIEQNHAEPPPGAGPDEMLCLDAMQRARYLLLRVESVEPDLGINVRDLNSEDRFLLADIGLSATAQPRLILASRVLFFEELAMTGGAALPVGILPTAQADAWMKDVSKALARQKDGLDDPAALIRACRERGVTSRVAYCDPEDPPAMRHAPAPARTESRKPGRNDPCPCGSGKKFKNCCLTRKSGAPI